jgi:hydroxyacyl-ACP dehydratase HTD2-like protein with hotdog domain
MTDHKRSQETLISTEAEAMIGTYGEYLTGYPVSEHEIERYCQAINDLNPLYVHTEDHTDHAQKDIVAPPLFYSIPFAHRQVSLDALNLDGIPEGNMSGLPQPPLNATRGVAGGVEIDFFRHVRPGDVLTVRGLIVDIYQKQGRSGPLVFTVIESTYTNQNGEIVCVERNTAISR